MRCLSILGIQHVHFQISRDGNPSPCWVTPVPFTFEVSHSPFRVGERLQFSHKVFHHRLCRIVWPWGPIVDRAKDPRWPLSNLSGIYLGPDEHFILTSWAFIVFVSSSMTETSLRSPASRKMNPGVSTVLHLVNDIC